MRDVVEGLRAVVPFVMRSLPFDIPDLHVLVKDEQIIEALDPVDVHQLGRRMRDRHVRHDDAAPDHLQVPVGGDHHVALVGRELVRDAARIAQGAVVAPHLDLTRDESVGGQVGSTVSHDAPVTRGDSPGGV